MIIRIGAGDASQETLEMLAELSAADVLDVIFTQEPHKGSHYVEIPDWQICSRFTQLLASQKIPFEVVRELPGGGHMMSQCPNLWTGDPDTDMQIAAFAMGAFRRPGPDEDC